MTINELQQILWEAKECYERYGVIVLNDETGADDLIKYLEETIKDPTMR